MSGTGEGTSGRSFLQWLRLSTGRIGAQKEKSLQRLPYGVRGSPVSQGSPASQVCLPGITVCQGLLVQEGESERQELNRGNSTGLSPPWRFCAGFPGL